MDFKPSPLQKLDLSLFGLKNEVYIKRDDLIHPIVSGNKWRKLKRNISYYKTIDSKGIISMGGAYSSHILALSYVCFKNNIPCVLMVRGEEPKQQSDILIQCLKYKAIINYCSRENYSSNIWMSNYCNDNYPSHFFIPEGAANEYGIKGCSEIIREISIDFDEIYCEVGTGATLAGISSALKPTQKVKGIVVLKGAKGIEKEIHDLYKEATNQKMNKNWHLNHDYHLGGYAKYNRILIEFMNDFYSKTQIKTDPIYSGKMFFALIDQLLKDQSLNSKTIIALHSGGLSGIPGFEKRYGIEIFN
ncbi:MAG: 1-aminocyclopropane-1-carboxylate deaminase/D-cysteine desulfhydrase [Parvicellaceae bacterium]